MTKRSNSCLEVLSPEVEVLTISDILFEILLPLAKNSCSLKDIFSFVSITKNFYQKWLEGPVNRKKIFKCIFIRSTELSKSQFHGTHFLHISQSLLAIMVEYTLGELVRVIKNPIYRIGPDNTSTEFLDIKTYNEVWSNVSHLLNKKEAIIQVLLDADLCATPIVEPIMLLVCHKLRIYYSIELCIYKQDDDYYQIYTYDGVDSDDFVSFFPIGMSINSKHNGFILSIK